MRRIFVGDIHGCREPFERLLDAVGFVAGVDRLLPVGDLANKGPDTEGVLDLAIQLGAEPVLGNHDLHWLDRNKATPRHAEWLRAQPLVRTFEDLVVVHAGVHPGWDDARLERLAAQSLSEADPEDVAVVVNLRYCDADGRRPDADWPPPGPPFRPWDDFYDGARRVVFGHWARRGLVVQPRCVGLDSGCVYGNPLSAWIAEEDRVVQVPGNAM